MPIKKLMELANTTQALNLVGHNISETKKKQSVGSITKLGVGNIVGTNLIGINASLIAGL